MKVPVYRINKIVLDEIDGSCSEWFNYVGGSLWNYTRFKRGELDCCIRLPHTEVLLIINKSRHMGQFVTSSMHKTRLTK